MGELQPLVHDVFWRGGRPAFGTYRGAPERVDYGPLLSSRGTARWESLWRRKRWIHLSMWHSDLIVALAIVDVGYAGSGFIYVFDRRERRFLVERNVVVPPQLVSVESAPGEGARARLNMPAMRRTRLSIVREPGQTAYRVSADLGPGGLRLHATVETAHCPPPVTALCEVPGGFCNTTVKAHLLGVGGEAELGSRHLPLDGALGALDFTDGLMARRTEWRWISASGRAAGHRVGLNLTSGFNAGRENVLWLDGQPQTLGAAQIQMDPHDPMRPWKVSTDCGRIDLRFAPLGHRRAESNLLVVSSKMVSPIGVFAGTIRDLNGEPLAIDAADLTGIGEDHLAVW
jgi:hypothetical protein